MALSEKAKEALRRAVTEDPIAEEIRQAIDSGGNPVAADPGDLGALIGVASVDVADLGPQQVADAADTDAKLASVQGKLDALMQALRAAGIIA